MAFDLEKGSSVPSDFVKSLLNSPKAGLFQRLHFYVVSNRRMNQESLTKNLIEAIETDSSKITRRPWCENLLKLIEIPDHCDIVHSNSEMIFIVDRFPKVCKYH